MALATRCPHCNTTFRVVEDQLKLYSGIVRCGVCHEIFNATDHIVDDSALAKSESSSPAPDKKSEPSSAQEAGSLAASPLQTPSVAAPVQPEAAVQAPATEIEPIPPAMPSGIPATVAPVSLKQDSVSPFIAESVNEGPAVPEADSSEAPSDSYDRIELDIPEQPFLEGDRPPAYPLEIDDLSVEDLSEKILREGKYDPMASEELQPFENTASRLHEEDWRSISLDLGDQREKESTPAHQEIPPDIPDFQPEPVASAAFEVHISDHAQPDDAFETGTSPIAEPDVPPAEPAAADAFAGMATPELSANAFSDDLPVQTQEPGFVMRAKKRQRSNKVMRWLLSLGSLVLLALLALQGVYAFHDRITALMPEAEPTVSEICGVLDCETHLTAKIDELSIDSNELQSLPNRPDTYALDVVLHNVSSSPQEWPHLELTLNDESGQPAIRRIFTPETYLADLPPSAEASLSKGFAPQSEQQIKLVFTLDQIKAAGYRVYIFYP